MMCDMCKSSENFEKCIISSKIHDIDICSNCAKTEQGEYLTKIYGMTEYPHALITFNYEFGSVLDWVPIYSDNENNYITVCLNPDNQMYQNVSIVHKNNRGNYEHTIMNKSLNEITENVENVENLNLSKLARSQYERENLETQPEQMQWIMDPGKMIIYNNRNPVDL
jgi:hypothetical protein